MVLNMILLVRGHAKLRVTRQVRDTRDQGSLQISMIFTFGIADWEELSASVIIVGMSARVG
jgi:hypothetical protein